MENQICAAVITVSDRVSLGEREDASGPLLAELLKDIGAQVSTVFVVPDEQEQIAALLLRLCHSGLDLLMTTGGTGPTPRDVQTKRPRTPAGLSCVRERQDATSDQCADGGSSRCGRWSRPRPIRL